MGVTETAQDVANTVADGFTNALDKYWHNPVFENGKYNLSPAGVLVLGVHVILTLLYFLWIWLRKTWKRWSQMDASAAGMFRLAAARGEVEKLDVLRKAWRFNINVAVEGWTALHAAATMGQPDSLAWLLSNGADLHSHKDDHWNDTVLHYGAASGSLDCVKILLSYGADPRAKNFAGLLPRDYAAANNHMAVAQHLDAVCLALGGSDGPIPASARGQAPMVEGALRTGETFYNSITQESAGQVERRGSDTGPGVEDPRVRQRRRMRKLCRRGFEGLGTPGTKRTPGNWVYRFLGVTSSLLGMLYLVWRATRSLTDGWLYFYSIPLFTVEWLGWMGWVFSVVGLWSTIDREPRNLATMVAEDKFPTVDVYVVAYNEPVSVIEPTTIAALNMNYPADKLTVYILDDGKREEVRNLALKLDFQCQFFKKKAKLCYISREKVKGVPHHAKAGNINHALLKAGVARGEYVLVLDCDMLCHPDFLLRTLGHMYGQPKSGQGWAPKEKVGFLQTPQDFWNVESSDPLFHLNSFFYGPMLKGRDGIGATPCCGTGVIFRRDVLVSIGGQSYGSVTEDMNSAMHLLMSGFSTMYLNEHLTFGMAPEDVPSTFGQRLRWAMGSVQIFIRNNPLKIPGLTHVQSILFYDVCISHFLAPCIIFVSVIPIVYLFTKASPIDIMQGGIWEFTVAFLAYYMSNRVAMLWAFHDSDSGLHDLWRTTQQAVWIAPNHLKAIWKVVRTEIPIIRWLSKIEVGFAVTRKEKEADLWRSFKETLACVWPYLLYYAAAIASFAWVIVGACLGWNDLREMLGFAGAGGWTVLTMLAIWPPIYTLLPRVYTDNGWKVVWRMPNSPDTNVGNAGTVPMGGTGAASTVQRAQSMRDPPTLMAGMGVGVSTANQPDARCTASDTIFEEVTLGSPTSPGVHASVQLSVVAGNGPVSAFSPLGRATAGALPPADSDDAAAAEEGRHGGGHKYPTIRYADAAAGLQQEEGEGEEEAARGAVADEVMHNFGRVGVGADRLRCLARQASSMATFLPARQMQDTYYELADLYHKVLVRVVESSMSAAPESGGAAAFHNNSSSNNNNSGNGDAPAVVVVPTDEGDMPPSAFATASRYPTIHHVQDSEEEQQQTHAPAAPAGRAFSLGGLHVRIRGSPAYDVTNVHDPRGLTVSGEAFLPTPAAAAAAAGDEHHGSSSALCSASPAVVQAVMAYAEDAAAAQQATTAAPGGQQFVSGAAAYKSPSARAGAGAQNGGGGERFVPFGSGGHHHVAASLLVEALDFALAHGATEQERVQLFANSLLSSQGFAPSHPGVAGPSPRRSSPRTGPAEGMGSSPGQQRGPAAMMPANAPAPPPAVVASAAALEPGSDSVAGGCEQGVLAQPDFSARRTPPRSYTFVVVTGVLVVGLAVAGVLDAIGVLDSKDTAAA